MSFIGIVTSNKNEETLKKGIAQVLKEENNLNKGNHSF